MSAAWYSEIADELARCLADAEACAEACEALLERTTQLADETVRRTIANAVVAPAAVARVLVDLLDQPQQFVLAAATLGRDIAADAIRALHRFPHELVGETCARLGAFVTSSSALLEAV